MTSPGIVYVVDDEPAFLRSLISLLHSAGIVVKAYASPIQFLAEHDPGTPGCAVVDLAMDEMDGLQVQQELQRQGSARPIIFLSGRATVPEAVIALKSGAVGFLIKPFEEERLIEIVEQALRHDAASRLSAVEASGIRSRMESLTPRERSILDHMMAGLLNKEIAARLGISVRTVKFHRQHLMKKLGVSSVIALPQLLQGAKEDAP